MVDIEGDWPIEKIKDAVYRHGISLQALAEREGLEASTCRSALIRRAPVGERVIAELLGVRPQEIWPSRYPPDGQRARRPCRPSRNLHAARSPRQRQKTVAP